MNAAASASSGPSGRRPCAARSPGAPSGSDTTTATNDAPAPNQASPRGDHLHRKEARHLLWVTQVNQAFLDGFQVGALVCTAIALGAAVVAAGLLPVPALDVLALPAEAAITSAGSALVGIG